MTVITKVICLYGDIYKSAGIKDCIVMGDFNRQGINWETLVTDGHGEKLLDTCTRKDKNIINIGPGIQL